MSGKTSYVCITTEEPDLSYMTIQHNKKGRIVLSSASKLSKLFISQAFYFSYE